MFFQADLERKMVSLSSSKKHYKEKWKEALSELSLYHKQEHDSAHGQLLHQEQELNEMCQQCLQLEKHNTVSVQVDVVEDIER